MSAPARHALGEAAGYDCFFLNLSGGFILPGMRAQLRNVFIPNLYDEL
jgi:hypothetical protein